MIIYALIPLRTGSIRIKNKNFVNIKKKPVYLHSLNQTLKSRLVTKVFLATNSKKIKIKHKKLSIFKRSKKSNNKKSSTEIVIGEFLKNHFCDYLVLIQATNLFIKAKHIDLAIKKVLNHGQYIQGPEVFELETKLISYSGAKYCVNCSSDNYALLMSIMAKGIGYGDKLSFDENGVSISSKSNEKYHLSNNQIKIMDE